MTRKIFGTDGVRGRANVHPMTASNIVQLATAVGRYFGQDQKRHRVVIGKDTRRSCYMLENALTAGFTSAGMDVFALGPMPTPAVGRLTHSMRADIGVMISASHNPHYDNGIKFFGPDGYKLSDGAEAAIENLMDTEIEPVDAVGIGRVTQLSDAASRYVEYVKTTLADRVRLNGLKVVLDCANGAAYKAAPQVLWELGAEVIPIGVNPNGYNINDGCGSTAPDRAAIAVLENKADVGICLDGDADRISIIDETGAVADGDQIMALLATDWARQGRLNNNMLVATVMSNLGLERHLNRHGVGLQRTPVGDRYVVQAMRAGGYNMGGEQSGHIVMTDYSTTGDGLVAGLQFLAQLRESGRKASELCNQFEPVPQLLKSINITRGTAPLEMPAVQAVIADGNARLKDKGRLLIRKSGTEPLIRVMGESEDEGLLTGVIQQIVTEIEAVTFKPQPLSAIG
ncbi:phosphoglucosamine mutase [Phaeobacter gallaeciensis]|uniref:Phosphoglucosamine mutase n=2 Tax=Roseobacteraceae TaxID=2854170 RepID=A0A366X0V2_9RHOB|nr:MULTISPECIES: phosphoglucosamine mutase [Roseobacteraceae]MBT3140023.1 phosphoglucosamine mutase [Falsiruegeria litorea]MBT8167170.1 phosphoglucosamine mutase [Falsiruegeria litorea]RBW57033.1 phosphoglucosamine mutase [Phaeobacter gallaeciensis]